MSRVASRAWQATGCGHLEPATERRQLHDEIANLMSKIEHVLTNTDLDAAERIRRIEELKEEIWLRKARIADIKAAHRVQTVAAKESSQETAEQLPKLVPSGNGAQEQPSPVPLSQSSPSYVAADKRRRQASFPKPQADWKIPGKS